MSTIISDSCRARHRRRARPLMSSSKVTFLSIILVSSGVSHCNAAIELAPDQYQNNIISNDSIDRSNGIHIDIADVSENAENDELHRLRGSRKLESAYHVQQNNFATIAIVNDESNNINSATERRRKLSIRRGDPPPPPNDGADTADNDNSNNNDAATNQNIQEGNGNGASTGNGGGGYGDYGSYMNSSPKVSPNEAPSPGVSPTTSTSTAAGGASNYGTSTTSNQASNTAGSYGSYGSSSYGGSTSGAASSYGSGSSTSAYGGSNTSAYGSGTYGGSSTSTAVSTTTKDSYSSAWGATGSSGSSWGSSTGSSGSSWGSKASSSFSKLHGPSVQLSIIPVILLSVLITFIGMLITAHRMENDPEGNFANCCRVLLHTVNCIYKVIYNLYHCRLGDIPQVVFASELEEEEYTEEEIERMRLRPGIERALDVEHRKALRKVGIEMNKIKVTTTTKR